MFGNYAEPLYLQQALILKPLTKDTCRWYQFLLCIVGNPCGRHKPRLDLPIATLKLSPSSTWQTFRVRR